MKLEGSNQYFVNKSCIFLLECFTDEETKVSEIKRPNLASTDQKCDKAKVKNQSPQKNLWINTKSMSFIDRLLAETTWRQTYLEPKPLSSVQIVFIDQTSHSFLDSSEVLICTWPVEVQEVLIKEETIREKGMTRQLLIIIKGKYFHVDFPFHTVDIVGLCGSPNSLGGAQGEVKVGGGSMHCKIFSNIHKPIQGLYVFSSAGKQFWDFGFWDFDPGTETKKNDFYYMLMPGDISGASPSG